MTGNGWKWLKGRQDWNRLVITRNCWKWYDMAGMANMERNGLEWLKMAGMA